MSTKYLSLMLAVFLLQGFIVPASAATSQTDAEAKQVAKVKTSVARRGLGEKARVHIRLRNGNEVKGYISQAGDESFTVMDSRTRQATMLAYRDVERIKGKGMPRAAWIAIGAGIGLAVVVVGLRTGGDGPFFP